MLAKQVARAFAFSERCSGILRLSAPCQRNERYSSTSAKTTIVQGEVQKFGALSKDWWTTAIPLVNLNKIRVPFATESILSLKQVPDAVRNGPRPLAGIKLTDIGCAAGIFSESLARIGADVTGIDASKELIEAARTHAALDKSLEANLRYLNTTVEEHVKENAEKYDALVCSEVIEHVNDPAFFVDQCAKLVKPNGSLIFTTINKSWLSGFNAIIWCEYLARTIPRGTHHYSMLISPKYLEQMLNSSGCKVLSTRGHNLKLNKEWKLTNSEKFFYAMHAVKK